jgi:hypothetical protein
MKPGLVCLSLLLGACSIPTTVERLGEQSPPPELGRPAWVKVCAGAGAWVGGIVGGVVSIVALPVSYPISLLADDRLGEQGTDEFLFWPAGALASVGHTFLGAPMDSLDWMFRRAWVDQPDPVAEASFVPLPGPNVPTASAPAPALAESPAETNLAPK